MMTPGDAYICVVCLDQYSNWDYDRARLEANVRGTCAICGLFAQAILTEAPLCSSADCGRIFGTCPHTPRITPQLMLPE